MKLSKSQINAIATKIQHELKEKQLAIITTHSRKYMPDAIKMAALLKEEEVINNKYLAIKNKYKGYMSFNANSKPEQIASEICKLNEINTISSLEAIENSLIIASVDAADMDALMKNYQKFLI